MRLKDRKIDFTARKGMMADESDPAIQSILAFSAGYSGGLCIRQIQNSTLKTLP